MKQINRVLSNFAGVPAELIEKECLSAKEFHRILQYINERLTPVTDGAILLVFDTKNGRWGISNRHCRLNVDFYTYQG